MAYQGNLLSKTLVIGIIILFIGMSVVSSAGNIVEDIPSNTQVLDSFDNSEKLVIRGKIAYAYIADPGSSGLPEGPCFFALDDPSNITLLKSTSSGNFLTGGTWCSDGRWRGCEYDSGCLWEIDHETGDMWAIGLGGISCFGLAWDPVYNRLYGTTGSKLVEYDPDTGEQEVIGSHGVSQTLVALVINLDGICYAWDVLFSGSSKFYRVDLETGEAIEIFEFGFPILYSGDGHFDYDTDILYMIIGNQLLKYDEYNLTVVGDFEGSAWITCLAIPYCDTTIPVTNISFDPAEPNGCNGWYVSNVTVNLKATDDMSGVDATYFRINDGDWEVYNSPFVLSKDGKTIQIEYYSVDNAGNVEDVKSATLDIDQIPPEVIIEYTATKTGWREWLVSFNITVMDNTSGCGGMNRIEIFLNGVLQPTIFGPGPIYGWSLKFSNGLSIAVGAGAWDKAGNYGYSETKISLNRNRIRHSIHPIFLRFFDRFPLLEVFLRAMNLLR